MCYYGPWTFALAFNLSIYLSVSAALSTSSAIASETPSLSHANVSTLASRSQLLSSKQEHQVILRLRLYLLVFFWVSFWSFGHRIDELVNPSHESRLTIFTIMHAFFRPLMGFMNSIVYGINRRLISEYRVLFRRAPPSHENDYHLQDSTSAS
eukprot:c5893_g1_i2.p1 GENE.c5893_g1_i2~~c5893_g1_i2.p1  ORF type:complete len:153 (-),score=23.56 c5893_g1_i2:40-498(-)